MPATGTRRENGATSPGEWRAMSQVQIPEPSTVPIAIV